MADSAQTAFPILRVKDRLKGANGEFHSPAAGCRAVDYQPVQRAATGLKHAFIEPEEFDIDPIEAIHLDAQYLRKVEI